MFNLKLKSMINLTDLDLNAINAKVNELITGINEDNWVITYNKQQVALDFNGEAHLEVLGYSFTPTKDASILDIDYDKNPYYQAQEHIFNQVRQMLADFMSTTEVEYEIKTDTENNHITWYTHDNDHLNLDFADDSIIITLYLSGQY